MSTSLNVRFSLCKDVINWKTICKLDFSHFERTLFVWEDSWGVSQW